MPSQNHPNRIFVTNELHARPFQAMEAQSSIGYFTLAHSNNGEGDTRVAEYECIKTLFDHFGAHCPPADANHFVADFGKLKLKWERHTEFSTYLLFGISQKQPYFSQDVFSCLPKGWKDSLPGSVLTSCYIEVLPRQDGEVTDALPIVKDHLFPESRSISQVLDKQALIATDFRMDENNHVRFLVVPAKTAGDNRIGRIVQRLVEIETYKTAAMLALPMARDTGNAVALLDTQLGRITNEIAEDEVPSNVTLDKLLELSTEIERLNTSTAFRFSASGAYADIVEQRIAVLREEQAAGFQTFSEFMMRRFEPAMRTCKSVESRLENLANRTDRASDLLRTRVDVEIAEENQKLLSSMNRRADLQLRLQETVEGLSVVAIAYYAVSLIGYLSAPLAKWLHIDKTILTALAVIPTMFVVFLFMRNVKRRIAKQSGEH